MTTFIISLITLFATMLLTLTCMASISSFISDRDNPFSIKTSKLLKNLDEFDNKKY